MSQFSCMDNLLCLLFCGDNNKIPWAYDYLNNWKWGGFPQKLYAKNFLTVDLSIDKDFHALYSLEARLIHKSLNMQTISSLT